jgi:hypothetical protein
MSGLARLSVLAFVAFGNQAPIGKNAPAMKMLMCDGCHNIFSKLSLDVKFLIEAEKTWPRAVLDERILLSCSDPDIPSGVAKEACGYVLEDYHTRIAEDVLSRLNPKHEMFEETIVPKEVCLDMGLCKEKQSSLGMMIGQQDAKGKWEEKNKEIAAKYASQGFGSSDSKKGDEDEDL